MSALKTYAVEIWITDCYLVTDINAPSPEAAEVYALDRWEAGCLKPVKDMAEVSSTHIEEMNP